MIESVRIACIRADIECQPRVAMLFDTVEDYANDMARGAEFPPVVVFFDGTEYWLADGFHRRQAAETLGLADLCADVRPGTRRDAILYSVSANSAHGMRRTNEDKRRAVTTLLNDAEWATWSDREIAQQCAVARSYVQKLRSPLPSCHSGKIDNPRIVTRNGTTYQMNTANIGGRRPSDGGAHEPPPFLAERPILYVEPQPKPRIDLSRAHYWHAVRDAVNAIASLPTPEETVREFPRALDHALRDEEVTSAARWLMEFARLWAEGQPERDRRKEAMLERAGEVLRNGTI